MSGYSDKSLIDKLGYKTGERVCLFHAPAWFVLELKSKDIIVIDTLPADWLQGFFANKATLQAFLAAVDLRTITSGLWVSWPKKASGVATDVSEQTFRDLILPLGWVDIKVAAIDDTWSGLKFVRRNT